MPYTNIPTSIGPEVASLSPTVYQFALDNNYIANLDVEMVYGLIATINLSNHLATGYY